MAKSLFLGQFSLFWAKIWYVASLGHLEKKWCRNFWNFDFFRFYESYMSQWIQKMAKTVIFHIWRPIKRPKMQKSKFHFFNTHKDAMDAFLQAHRNLPKSGHLVKSWRQFKILFSFIYNLTGWNFDTTCVFLWKCG